MNEVVVYLVLTLALSVACYAGTWFFYKAFVLYVDRFDRRNAQRLAKKRQLLRLRQQRQQELDYWRASEAARGYGGGKGHGAAAAGPPAPRADRQQASESSEDFWPEIIDG